MSLKDWEKIDRNRWINKKDDRTAIEIQPWYNPTVWINPRKEYMIYICDYRTGFSSQIFTPKDTGWKTRKDANKRAKEYMRNH